MEDRLTFLHFLFIEASYTSVTETSVNKVYNELNKTLGETKNQRRMLLSAIHNKYVKCLPDVRMKPKKKSNFSMTRV